MSKKIFFASAAKAAFALAAVVIMSLAFAACGSDNDDDGGGGGIPDTSLPEPKAQTVTIDGKEKPIVSAEYIDEGSGDYSLYLYLSADRKEKVEVQLNKDLHITGSPVKLTEKEKKHKGKWYWAVNYYGDDGKQIIHTFGEPGTSNPVFNTGTLTMSGDPKGTINIKLENGRVKGKDGKEHTITLSYSGKMTKAGSTPKPPTPTAGTVTLDSKEKPIVSAEYIDEKVGDYSLYLYLSADRKERVIIFLNKDLHMTGSPVDLTKKEKEHEGKFYWTVNYYDANGKRIIETWGKPDRQDYPVFKTGTLTISGDPKGTINIKLENGRVKGTNGKEHTLILSYSGKMTAKE